MNRPLVWLAACFSSGIFLQNLLKPGITVLFGAALIFMAAGILSVKKQRNTFCLVLVLYVIGGALWLSLAEATHFSRLKDFESKYLTLHGVIVSYPEKLGDKVICDIIVDRFQFGVGEWHHISREKVRCYFFSWEDTTKALAYGDTLTVRGKLVLPQGQRNPGDFDYSRYLKFRGIYSLLYVYQKENVAVSSRDKGNPAIGFTLGIREDFSEFVRGNLPERQAVLLLAMLFGEQRAVFEEDMEMFRETGIAHALSVSGFHIGLVLLLVFAFCRITGIGQKKSLAVSLSALLFYCILSAFTVTVVRAAIMGTAGLLSYTFDREHNIYVALSAAGLAILIWNPYFLFDPGFQMSFAAVWAMAYLEPLLKDLLPDLFYGHSQVLTIPVAAQLGTMPFVAYHFNMVSPLAVLANIFLVPIMSGIVIIGLCAFAFLWFPLLGDTLLQASGFLINVLVASGGLISRLPGTVFFVAPPSFLMLVLYFVLVIISRMLWQGSLFGSQSCGVSFPADNNAGGLQKFFCEHGKNVGAAVLICALLLVVVPGEGSEDLRIYFLDVGQGDAMLIQGPSGNTALVDGGGMPGYMSGGYDPGKDTVLPFLHWHGVPRLDLIINTHPDEDHLDGLEDVLEEMPVSRVITPPVEGWEDKYASFLNIAGKKGTPHMTVSRGAVIRLDKEVFIRVLSPPKSNGFESSNDVSLVLQVCHGSNRFLLLGDLEKEGIDSLIDGNADLQSSLIKIPHHGGKGSFEVSLYKKVSPEIAVISVGKNNTFGHPAPEVVDYCQSKRIRLYRTDLNGCVIVASDGKKCVVETIR